MDNHNIDNPYILEETENFAVVYKPPKMHCTPGESGYTLLNWYTANSAKVFDIMHRLDYETHGLVLFARNEKSFNYFKDLQDKGEFIKEYSAVCLHINRDVPLEGFPPYSSGFSGIESYFRPFGPGRKVVRPVLEEGKKHKEIAKDKGGFYKTEIVSFNDNNFILRLKRGFRHQIRCHLCWIGYPILNDPLYFYDVFDDETQSALALRAHALFFTDPENGIKREYKIETLNKLNIKI
ncbi:MAG: RNA pseudouridine synthase [Treponema sp.]|nr:RNA pseudouridine synthase [Treponema sp.]